MPRFLQKYKLHHFMAMLILASGVVIYFAAAGRAAAQNTQTAGKYDTTGKTGIVQCGNKTDDPCTVEDVFNIFIITTNLAVGAVGLIAIYGIVYSAFGMVRSDGNTESMTAAKKGFTNSLVGLGMVLLAFIFVNLVLYGLLGINPDKGILTNPAGFIGGAVSKPGTPAANTGGTNSSVPPTN
jgi:type IV secretion system pilin